MPWAAASAHPPAGPGTECPRSCLLRIKQSPVGSRAGHRPAAGHVPRGCVTPGALSRATQTALGWSRHSLESEGLRGPLGVNCDCFLL